MTPSTRHSRLVFQKLESRNFSKDVFKILCGEQILTREKALLYLRRKTPAVLLPETSHSEAESIRRRLQRLDCLTTVEPLVDDHRIPFPMTAAHCRQIKSEFSKADRTKTTVVIVLARATPASPDGVVSILGPGIAELETSLRLSDTVIGVDDERAVVLGFTTSHEHADLLQSKVVDGLRQHLGETAAVSAGYAVFPSEGRSLGELLHRAESLRIASVKAQNPQANKPLAPDRVGEPSHAGADNSYISLVFRNAYGRQFQKLLTTLDTETLYAALCKFDGGEQRDILARIDNSLPVARELADRFRSGDQPAVDPSHAVADCIEPALFQKELEVRRSLHKTVMQTLDKAQTLPTLPELAMQVFELASDPDASAKEATAVISRDPALSAKLLQIVNSPFYGFSAKIKDIGRAVVLLGFNEVVDISLGLAVANVMKNAAVSQFFNPKLIWHHSYITGLLASSMCKNYSPKKRSWVFTTALLHDIGKIFLAEHFSEAFKSSVANTSRFSLSSCEAEREIFGVCHATVGKVIATRWNFPELVIESIAHHHTPNKETHSTGLPAITGFADYLYNLAIKDSEVLKDAPHAPAILTYGQWKMLTYYINGLTPQSIERMKRFAVKTINENSSVLEMV